LADATGALGLLVEDWFFLLTSHVFGLQGIQNLIAKHPVLHFKRTNIFRTATKQEVFWSSIF
jgi:hypothetical protein